MDTFNFYANYTIFVLEDQLDAADTMWFPVFAHYDERFRQQIASHKMLRSKIEELKLLLPAKQKTESLQQSQEEELSDAFRDLHDIANQEFDREEALLNSLGHRVPIDEIRELERRQQERRRGAIRIYGHLWSAVYLLRSLNANERAIFPPAIPRVAVRGMLTVGSFQYRRFVSTIF